MMQRNVRNHHAQGGTRIPTRLLAVAEQGFSIHTDSPHPRGRPLCNSLRDAWGASPADLQLSRDDFLG
jgi:hypothetical protein